MSSNRVGTRHLDVMEFDRIRTEDDEEEDAALQYMIEQSLLERNKQGERPHDSTPQGTRRSDKDKKSVWVTLLLIFCLFLHH